MPILLKDTASTGRCNVMPLPERVIKTLMKDVPVAISIYEKEGVIEVEWPREEPYRNQVFINPTLEMGAQQVSVNSDIGVDFGYGIVLNSKSVRRVARHLKAIQAFESVHALMHAEKENEA